MRELRFRSWNLDKKEWVTDWDSGDDSAVEFMPDKKPIAHMLELIDECVNGEHEQYDSCEAIENIEVTQHTGLKDKNGKRLFAGDVIEVGVHRSIICCENSYVSFFFWCESIHEFTSLAFLVGYRDFEIVGNIYEDPEMVELIEIATD